MRFYRGFFPFFVLLISIFTPPISGQNEDSLKKEIEQLQEQLNILREEQLKMRRDLEQIKVFVWKQMQAAQDQYRGKTVSTDGDPFKGDPDARLTLIEFSDFQ